MKTKNIATSLLSFAMLSLVLLCGCDDKNEPTPPPVEEVTMSIDCGSTLTLAKGGSPVLLTAHVKPFYKVKWSESQGERYTISVKSDSTALVTPSNIFMGVEKIIVQALDGSILKKSITIDVTVSDAPPAELTATAQKDNTEVKLNWKAIEGIKSYCVYTSADNGKYTLIAYTTTNSYVDDMPMAGDSYYKVSTDIGEENTNYIKYSSSVNITGIPQVKKGLGTVFTDYLKTILPITAFDGEMTIVNSPQLKLFSGGLLVGLELSNKGLQDLGDIKYFVGLQALDVSNSFNPNTGLPIGGVPNEITSLDLTRNINLYSINCNGNKITSIDMSTQRSKNLGNGSRIMGYIGGGAGKAPYNNPITDIKVNKYCKKEEIFKTLKTSRGADVKISVWDYSSADEKPICTDYDPNTDVCATP